MTRANAFRQARADAADSMALDRSRGAAAADPTSPAGVAAALTANVHSGSHRRRALPSLVSLDIAHNKGGQRAAAALCAVLRSNSVLTALDISWNCLGSRGADFIAPVGAAAPWLAVATLAHTGARTHACTRTVTRTCTRARTHARMHENRHAHMHPRTTRACLSVPQGVASSDGLRKLNLAWNGNNQARKNTSSTLAWDGRWTGRAAGHPPITHQHTTERAAAQGSRRAARA